MPGNIARQEIAMTDVASSRPPPTIHAASRPPLRPPSPSPSNDSAMFSRSFGTKRSGLVVAGHQRLKILKAEKVRKTTVVVVDLDERSEPALNV